ncbi:hypothetical protein E5D57_001064 [Metarhizium anisopliae]|nr:hypothetical protein E5D57_001064 [Metarhizium anisopliae]
MLTDLYSQNISYVDSIGMILSTQATTEDGSGKLLTKGLGSGAVSAYARAWRDWEAKSIVQRSGAPVRVLSRSDYAVIKPSDLQNYWQAYVDQVWSCHSHNPLAMDTQGSAGKVIAA